MLPKIFRPSASSEGLRAGLLESLAGFMVTEDSGTRPQVLGMQSIRSACQLVRMLRSTTGG